MRPDINCDLGEGIGNDALIIPFITSANIACGYHAGDIDTMHQTIAICLKRTDLEGNNANDSVRPYVFGNKLMEAVNAAMLNAGCENGFCINYTPLRIMTPRASSCLIAAVFCSSVMVVGQTTA